MSRPGNLALLAALFLIPPPLLHADQVHLADGQRLEGELVTLILRDPAGSIHQVSRGQALAYTYGLPAAPADIPSGTGTGWGQRPGESAPTSPGPLLDQPPLEAPALVLDLHYFTAVDSALRPEAGYARDPGPSAEVFVYQEAYARDRTRWIRLGEARRHEDVILSSLDDAQELTLLRTLIRNPELSRKDVLAQVDAAQNYEHHMRYRFADSVRLKPATWTVYVNFPGLRRHKIFRGVRFLGRDTPVTLSYEWSSHSSFGK